MATMFYPMAPEELFFLGQAFNSGDRFHVGYRYLFPLQELTNQVLCN
jgi:hypothetical protein